MFEIVQTIPCQKRHNEILWLILRLECSVHVSYLTKFQIGKKRRRKELEFVGNFSSRICSVHVSKFQIQIFV